MTNFTIEAQPFLSRLSLGLSILKQFSSTEQKIGLHSDGKNVWLVCIVPTVRVLMSVDDCCVAPAKFSFGVNPEVISGLIGGRKTVEFTVEGNTLSLGSRTKGSNYQGKGILLLPFDDTYKAAAALLVSKKLKKTINLNKAALEHLYKGSSLTALSAFTSEAEELLIHVRAINKKFQISCADNLHMAYYESAQVDVVDFHAAMRGSYFEIVKKLTNVYPQDLELAFTDSHIVVSTPKFYIDLPLIQVDSRNFDRVRERLIGVKPTGLQCTTPRKALDLVVQNVYGVFEKGSQLNVTPVEQAKKPTVRFGMKTGHGEVSDDLRVESLVVGKKMTFSMDPVMLEESLRKFEGNLEFGISLNPKTYLLRQEVNGSRLIHSGMLV